jgi:hypothetical protein
MPVLRQLDPGRRVLIGAIAWRELLGSEPEPERATAAGRTNVAQDYNYTYGHNALYPM